MTLTSWGAPAPSPLAAPAIPPVRLLIVAQPGHAQAFYAAFAADARFAVQAVATSADDARAKLTLEPEAVVVEVVVFSGPPEFANTFAAYRGAAFAIVPANLGVSLADAVRQVPCVLRVTEGEPNFAATAGEVYAAVVARRPAAGKPADSFTGSRELGVAMIGWRAIAVWSPQGGVGKSTVALALAMEALARRLPTLLVGLAAPRHDAVDPGRHPAGAQPPVLAPRPPWTACAQPCRSTARPACTSWSASAIRWRSAATRRRQGRRR